MHAILSSVQLTDEIDLRESPAWLLTAIRTLTKTAISKVFEKVRETPIRMRLPDMLSTSMVRGNPVHRFLCTGTNVLSMTYRVAFLRSPSNYALTRD
jgi:hypothetical protein